VPQNRNRAAILFTRACIKPIAVKKPLPKRGIAMTESQKIELRTHLNNELASLNGASETALETEYSMEYTADDIDYASQLTQRNLNLALAERASSKLSQLEVALKRIDSPEYGECEACGEHIGMARLKANPSATLCVRCQEERDNGFGACA
jgi:DnaK suppressor protein